MAEAALPAAQNPAPNMTLPAGTVGAGDWRARLTGLTQQPAFRRSLPALIGVGAVAAIAALYLAIAQGPQRILYGNLSDGERAQVVQTLEQGGINYTIDSGTGMVSVSEADVYRARMLVASDAGLAAPQSSTDMLDSIPLGSSRTLEGERLKLARERELMMTIQEIDGIEAVRVHLATPERSVFVRDANPPSASVMVRLAGGRTLSQNQVEAIVNLVSGSVPGMSSDSVRVVDQNGRLLSSERDGTLDGLVLQREFESKLREQVSALLMPLLGDGNFTAQVQVELDQNEVTSARESYEPEGVVRSESERNSSRAAGAGAAGGVPGVLANTPPPPTEIVEGAPNPETDPAAEATPALAADTETAATRAYEVGREVAVTNTSPGGLLKLSVAVAVSEEALAAAAPMTAEEVQSLVTAAVGASDDRGDLVTVVVSKFDSTEMPPLAFYETPWFANVLRIVGGLIAVLLVLLMAVRPILKRMRGDDKAGGEEADKNDDEGADENGLNDVDSPARDPGAQTNQAASGSLPEQVELARQLAVSQPERAVATLQRMLQSPDDTQAQAKTS